MRTWDSREAGDRVVRYLFEEKLKWTSEQIKEQASAALFKQYKLKGMMTTLYNGSPYQAVNSAYPSRFKPWEMKAVPLMTWTPETATEATKWLIEEKLKYTIEDVKNKLTETDFTKYVVYGAITIHSGNQKLHSAVNAAYPGQVRPWELQNTSIHGWTKEMAVSATKWLLEEKLGRREDVVVGGLNASMFEDHGLLSMLVSRYKYSPYAAIQEAYPDMYHPWECGMVPQGFWTEETGRQAMEWLIKDVLKWNIDDVKNKLDSKLFEKHNLSGMLQTVYGGSPYQAVKTVFGDGLKPWELKCAPMGTWNLETARAAVVWLVEERLKWSKDEAKRDLKYGHIKDNGLLTLLSVYYKNSIRNMLEDVYPTQPWKTRNYQ